MTDSQRNKAKRFRALHEGPGAFVMGNVWDAGSARIVAGLGFEALAHARAVTAAVDLPVSADYENGFGHAPDYVAETIRLAAEAGLVGCSIEVFHVHIAKRL